MPMRQNWLPRRRQSAPPSLGRWDLSTPLLNWTTDEPFTIGQSFENCLITGGTGSAKTSGSGRAIALAMLRAGYSGLVTTVKPDECRMWEEYCRRAGRLADLMVVRVDAANAFNALDYEASLDGDGPGLTENVVSLFMALAEVTDRHKGASGGTQSEGPYWERAGKQLIRNLVDLMLLATGRVSVADLYRVLVSAPASLEEVASEQWRHSSFCYRMLVEAEKRLITARQRQDFECVAAYLLREYATLASRTRSIVVSTFTSLADVLNRGLLRDLVCGATTITPDAILEGKVIVLDLPLLVYREVGLYAQTIWKLMTQRCIQRRDVRANPRPVFIFMDEAQYFLTSGDSLYLSTCRSSRAATVLLTQNIPGMVAALGAGDKGRAECDSIAGNCVTKICHANGDPTTNEWASTLIGKTRQFFLNGGSSRGPVDIFGSLTGLGYDATTNGGFAEQTDYEVLPHTFTRLRTGGTANSFNADAIVFRSGSVFKSTGTTWLPVTFDQRFP